MGDAADDLYDMEMTWSDHREWCEIHQMWYLGYGLGTCPSCEDGEPAVDGQPRK